MNYLQRKKLAFMSVVNQVKGFVRTVMGVPPLVLPDCVGGDNLLNYTIEGNSVQNGTPTPDTPVEIESVGEKTKNLFNVNAITSSRAITQNGDGTITVNNYPSNTVQTLSQLCPDLKVGDKILATMITEGASTNIYFYNTEKSLVANKNDQAFTVTQEDLDSKLGFYCGRTEDKTNVPARISNIQFLYADKGENLYEPYGYKIPIKVRSRNLFNIDNLTFQGGNFEVKDGVIKNVSSSTFDVSEETLSQLCPELKAGDTIITHFERSDPEDWAFLILIGPDQVYPSTGEGYAVTQEDLSEPIIFYMQHNNSMSEIQFRLTSEVSDSEVWEYEPYQEPIETAIYLDEPLRKVGDVADYIDFENGKVVRNIKTQYLDPNYNSITKYTWVNKVGVYFWGYLDNAYEIIPGLSNRNAEFTVNTQATTSMWLGITNKNFFWIGILDYLGFVDDDTLTAIDKFRVWLADNPTYIYYPTSTPTEELIKLPNIPTLKGSTILSPGTTVQPSSMSATYYSTSKE